MEGIKGQATLWVLVMTVTLAVAGFSLPSTVWRRCCWIRPRAC